MPIIRNLNPFRRQDENARPIAANGGFGRASEEGAKSIDIKQNAPTEYQLSEINDSGVFMPPSPPERKALWSTNSSRSTTSSNYRSLLNENEPFNISRESFDSYRRSFDISARSPVVQPENRPRASLDSRNLPSASRVSSSYNRPIQAPLRTQTEEPDALEDVSLEDPKPQPKKRGVFSRIMDGASSDAHHGENHRPASSEGAGKSSWHHFGGRKRGQSGSGSELGAIPKRDNATPKPESQLKKEEKAPVDTPVPAATTAPIAAAAPTASEEQSNGFLAKPGDNFGKSPEIKVDS